MRPDEIFRTICRVTGQMALQLQVGRVNRMLLLSWAEALEQAAREMRRLVEKRSER